MAVIEISSLDAPELDVYLRFTENNLRNRLDPENSLFIAESPNVIRTALDSGLEPVSLFCEKNHLAEDIMARVGDIPVYLAEKSLISTLKGYAVTRGMHSAMKRPTPKTPKEVLTASKCIAVLENIVDATNVGAIFRSAAALGIDALLLSPASSDPLVRRCVRVSMGTVFQIPWAFLTGELYENGIDILHDFGFKTVAMALSDNSVSLDDDVLKREEKLAIILGTEGDGLKKETINASDYVTKIPMHNGVDSLNVSVAAALSFWELRKR